MTVLAEIQFCRKYRETVNNWRLITSLCKRPQGFDLDWAKRRESRGRYRLNSEAWWRYVVKGYGRHIKFDKIFSKTAYE